MHATIPQATITALTQIPKPLNDLGSGFFYTTSDNGTVTLWHASRGDTEACQLAQRHPGTSGKDAATIANDMLLGA
jgi:hypothetical protein